MPRSSRYQPTVRKDGFDHDAMNRARKLFLSSKHKNDIHFCLIVYPNHGGMLADARDPDDINEWMDTWSRYRCVLRKEQGP
jgi:hypothetical protein